MTLLEAVLALTAPYRDAAVYSDGAYDYDADNLTDWARDNLATEREAADEAGDLDDWTPREYTVDGDAVYALDDNGCQESQATVTLKRLAGWDVENPGPDGAYGLLPEETWPDERAWRAWVVAA